MASPRERRLASDLRQMTELAASGALAFRSEGDPPERYRVLVTVPGLARSGDELGVRDLHRFETYLHRDYPRRPPLVQWLTPVFHPNLLGPERNGGVCIGSWSASESLADLCLRLRELVAWRALNADDALDPEAAAWAREHDVPAGADVAALARLGAPRTAVAVAGAGAEDARA
jgi:ubiquitin-protein ligase